MPAEVTLQEVWELFRETDRQIRALIESGARVDDKLDRLAETVAANSAEIAERSIAWPRRWPPTVPTSPGSAAMSMR